MLHRRSKRISHQDEEMSTTHGRGDNHQEDSQRASGQLLSILNKLRKSMVVMRDTSEDTKASENHHQWLNSQITAFVAIISDELALRGVAGELLEQSNSVDESDSESLLDKLQTLIEVVGHIAGNPICEDILDTVKPNTERLIKGVEHRCRILISTADLNKGFSKR